MIFGLDVSHGSVEKNISFIKRDLGRRQQVLYQKTIELILQEDLDDSKLVIPDTINGCDYSFEKFIEFIRIDVNEHLARIPIIVLFESKSDFSKFSKTKRLEKLRYNKIAVAITEDLQDKSLSSEINKITPTSNNIDSQELIDYRELAIRVSPKAGRHDMSNMWGPYILMRSLLMLEPENQTYQDRFDRISSTLLEDLYYKSLIQKQVKPNIDDKRLGALKKQRDNLKSCLPKKILVVEDQLKDGWESAYRSIFPEQGVVILPAKNRDEAQKYINDHPDIELIMLDVRLDEADRKKAHQDESNHEIHSMSGVRFANWIRNESQLPTVPIIAATASNKSWTLEALIDKGINSYWVKGSPEAFNTTALGIENAIDLYRKISDTLDWSRRVGPWQKEIYRIAKITGEPYLLKKAQSLQALLFRSFSLFSKELSRGLQIDLAFLEIYSCMNDLTGWICKPRYKKVDGKEIVELRMEGESSPLAEGTKYKPGGDYFWKHMNNSKEDKAFPDTELAIIVLDKKGMDFEKFRALSKKRNKLPLIHGRPEFPGEPKTKPVCESDITNLVELMVALVDQHKGALEAKKNNLLIRCGKFDAGGPYCLTRHPRT